MIWPTSARKVLGGRGRGGIRPLTEDQDVSFPTPRGRSFKSLGIPVVPQEQLSDRKPLEGLLHKGGTVKKDGAYGLKKGETVLPAPKKNKGRQSRYRAVYLERRKT